MRVDLCMKGCKKKLFFSDPLETLISMWYTIQRSEGQGRASRRPFEFP